MQTLRAADAPRSNPQKFDKLTVKHHELLLLQDLLVLPADTPAAPRQEHGRTKNRHERRGAAAFQHFDNGVKSRGARARTFRDFRSNRGYVLGPFSPSWTTLTE